jgi:hypothetical protein
MVVLRLHRYFSTPYLALVLHHHQRIGAGINNVFLTAQRKPAEVAAATAGIAAGCQAIPAVMRCQKLITACASAACCFTSCGVHTKYIRYQIEAPNAATDA